MATYTTIETRQDINTPFFNDNPAFSELHDKKRTELEAIGGTLTITTSEDNLVRTYVKTVPENQLVALKAIDDGQIADITKLFEEATPEAPIFFQNDIVKEFDSTRSEQIYNGTITV